MHIEPFVLFFVQVGENAIFLLNLTEILQKNVMNVVKWPGYGR